ncbi:hypothetical protein V8D89_010026 [Ganoderma adspersum]
MDSAVPPTPVAAPLSYSRQDNTAPSNVPVAFTNNAPFPYDGPFIDPILGQPINSPSPLPDENLYWEFRGDGYWHVRCNLCGTMVNTGNGRAQKTSALATHRTGKLCKKFRWNPHLESPRVEAIARAQAQTLRDVLLPPSPSPNAWSRFLATGRPARTPSPSPDDMDNLFEVITPHRYRNTVYPGLESSDGSDMDVDTPIWLAPHSPPPLEHPPPRCPGILLDWPRDQFFESYPFQRHGFSASALGYHFCSVERNGSVFWVRSDSCSRVQPLGHAACTGCMSVREKVARLATMAQFALPHTNHAYLTHEQLRELLRDRDQTLQRWKLKSLNLLRKCATALQKLDDYHRFVMAVATADVPRLNQLVSRGMKEKAGIGKIISRIEDALNGAYQARGYDSDDHDMALLVLRLGGRKLLYAMSQYIALPSLRSLRRATTFTNLMPSLGAPKLDDILFNIKQLFHSRASTLDSVRPFSSGIVLMWDEVNMEETACYFPHADSVGGFCREHSAVVNTRLSTFDTAVNLARRLFEGTLHYGKEASIIAVSSFGRSLRGAYPVLVSPTCKAESPHDSGVLLSRVVDAWKSAAAPTFGPIWSFASDGDAGRRAMVYQQFMRHPITRDHALFPYLGHLPGLNLLVGDGDITGDFDWKHELKRIGRLFRTQEGVMIGNTIINHELFKRHLRRGDRMETEVAQLMDPADSQDVPRAIEFLEAVEAIGTLPLTDCDPGVQHEAALIGAVGELFVSFMDAFIRPDWSLSEQLTSLSKFAHASYILFRRGGVNFMPNQLYGDMQTTVKNAYFCIAKQQLLDDTQPFYLFWLGDDRLETLFGRVRMQGAHNPNFSFKQLLDRLGAAMDLDAIFARHPQLDSGFRRLKITRTEHLDHLNPESWRGSAIVNKVSLESAWTAGRVQAEALLASIQVAVDFTSLLGPYTSADLFCQRQDGSWPGVALDESSEDRSLEPDELLSSVSLRPPPHPDCAHTSGPHTAKTTLSTPQQQSEPFPRALLDPGGPVNAGDGPPATLMHTDVLELGEDKIARIIAEPSTNAAFGEPDLENSEGLDLEDAIEDPEEAHALPRPCNVSADVTPWLEYEGRKVHKASICRLVITPEYTRKSHERLLRVRGYTSESKVRPNYDTSDLLDTNGYMVGDLFTALIRCDKQACIAVLKTIAIEERSTRVERVLLQNLAQPASSIRLSGQLLALRPTPCTRYIPPSTLSDSQANMADSESGSLDTPYSWVWDGSFVQLALHGKQAEPLSTSKSIRKTLVVRLPSHICEPVNPHVIDIKDRLPCNTLPYINASGLTWELTDAELTVLMASLWDKVQKHNALPQLPRFRESQGFPYRDMNGTLPSVFCKLCPVQPVYIINGYDHR